MIPKRLHQTTHPAMHRNKNIKINDTTIANPRAASRYIQLFMTSEIKLATYP